MKGLGLYHVLVFKLIQSWRFGLLNIDCIFFGNKTKQEKKLKHITKKGFINLQFLQNFNSQKPFWDEARLSSLVN